MLNFGILCLGEFVTVISTILFYCIFISVETRAAINCTHVIRYKCHTLNYSLHPKMFVRSQNGDLEIIQFFQEELNFFRQFTRYQQALLIYENF